LVTSSKKKWQSLFGKSLINIVLTAVALACIIPFVLVISVSLSTDAMIRPPYGFGLLPRGFTLDAYRHVFMVPQQIFRAYGVSIFVTVVGTILSVLMMAMASYCLARKNFRFRRPFMFYIFFTMLFNGGMIPTYIWIADGLSLLDNIWVLILPTLVNAFHIVLLRTFFANTPPALFEAAKIDGASEFTIFMKVAMPLALPAIATVSLLGALGRWNDWFLAMLYIRTQELYPLQLLLHNIMMHIQFVAQQFNTMPQFVRDMGAIPTETVRMAMVVVASGPMLFIFPFFQKYFVRGLTVGSVKE